MKQFTYSITMPHYNSFETLRRMIGSIPDRDDIQIIVVDDYSRPECRNRLSELKHKNLEIYYQPSNQGAANARNEASKHISGKWLLAVDCDDMFAEGAFDVLDRYKDENIDYLSYCISCRSPKNLEPCAGHQNSDFSVRKYLADNNSKNLRRFLFMNTDTWNKMVSMRFIRENGIHWEYNCRINVDVLYSYMIALKATKFKVIPDELYWYIGDASSITKKERSIEREFQFFLAAQKRNGFFLRKGYGYPFYRPTWLYIPFLIKKRGLADTCRFFIYCYKHRDEISDAKKQFLFLSEM